MTKPYIVLRIDEALTRTDEPGESYENLYPLDIYVDEDGDIHMGDRNAEVSILLNVEEFTQLYDFVVDQLGSQEEDDEEEGLEEVVDAEHNS